MTDGAANSPKTGTGRHELPTELETPLPAALYLNLKSVRRRICGHGAQRGANRTPSASLSAAAPPSNSGRGFQRGGTAVPPLCATRGYGGKRAKRRRGRIKRGAFEEMARLAAHQGRESYRRDGVRWRPPCFGWGSKGEGLCAKDSFPLPRSGNCPLREQREYPLWLRRESRPFVVAQKTKKAGRAKCPPRLAF